MTLLVGEDFFDLFRTFEHTAYRLEVRESYYEKEQLGQFLAGQRVNLTYMEAWFSLIVQRRVEGKRIERVRVVSRPHSDYTRYGLWLCAYNTQAGEDIRYLERQHAAGLPDLDYWLLDSNRLYAVRFGEGDDLLGAELVEDPAAVIQAGWWRDVAWHHAVPYSEYVKATGFGVEHPTSA
ncbi:MAG: hypothetical protein HYR62_03375 [Actinobacteria bacterium]|nr:hypothetical protein [Actinomycetota bacterium]MBI3686284.1 hypothetical protein [Actinomycetota bacterium]